MSWYLLGAVVLLALSFWVPYWTAERTARIEQRAEQLAACLLDATPGMTEPDPFDLEVALARFFQLAGCRGVHTADLEPLEPLLPGTLLSLQNKHYALHLAISPPDAAALVGPETVPDYEALAWPLSPVGPGHCVFFSPDNAPRAFTRNLWVGYVGLGTNRPTPGICHRRPAQGAESTSFYRSVSDERWILY